MESHQPPYATSLDQALRARTMKGLVGPAAYAVLKRMQAADGRR